MGSNPTFSAITCLVHAMRSVFFISLTLAGSGFIVEPELEPRMEPNVVESVFKYGIDYQLHLRKGKYYISKKAPHDIAFMYPEGRYRVSAGTPDKSLANARAQDRLRTIEAHFDASREKLNPFIEGVRPFLESNGVAVSDWYQTGLIKHELYREQTWLWKVTGGSYEFEKREGLGYWKLPAPLFENDEQRLIWEQLREASNATPKSKHKTGETLPESPAGWGWDVYYEEVVAGSYVAVAILVGLLGGYLPTHLLNEVDDVDERDLIIKLTEPLKPDYHTLFSDDLPKSRLRDQMRANVNNLPTRPVLTIADAQPDRVKFSDVVEGYLNSKQEASKARSQRLKACEWVVSVCGDLPLAEYTKLHAYDIASEMRDQGYSNSQISKMITYGRGLFKYATKTRGTNREALLDSQPWTGIELNDYGKKVREYLPLDENELHALFELDMGTQERLLLSILVTTGMRLDEVALMTWDRIREHKGILCFCLDERVKNEGSKRYIPVPDIIKPMLVGKRQGRLFTYRIDRDGKAQAKASDACMALIRQVTQDARKVAHSLRGNFKDALRELEVSKEVNDFITGHAKGDVGGKYGEGPSIAKRASVMNEIPHTYLRLDVR